MTRKAVVPRLAALNDIDDAFDYYGREGGRQLALRFADALMAVLDGVATRPATGSTRYAHELQLTGLRSRTLKRFPYMVFYVEHAAHIDLWRVLHSKRDVLSSLTSPEAPKGA